jgi:GT2 family glycosyltransferase
MGSFSRLVLTSKQEQIHEMKPLSIVILSHNRLDELSKNLPYLFAETHDEFQFIIVDNGSTDGSWEFLQDMQQKYENLVIVHNQENLGTAFGRNAGFALTTSSYILAMDDDTYIAPDDLRKIPSLFDSYPGAGILSFQIKHPITKDIQNPHGEIACEITHHHGACFAFRKEIINNVGGIDDECDYGGEEPDFAIRVRALGYSVLYIPEITAWHNSIVREFKEEEWRLERRVYHKIRLFYKYFPKPMARRYATRHLVVSLWGWYTLFGLRNITRIFKVARDGSFAGTISHQDLPDFVVKFYTDSKLRPVFGNVPIFRLAIDHLRRKYCSSL